jgi:acetyltransferase
LKIVSRDILHKSDAGGVALGLDDRKELMDAYEAILHNARRYNSSAVIDGVEVAEMIKPGAELIVGARVDRSFGPVVMCGFGGIYVEVMKDVAFRASPLSRQEVMTMLKEIRSFPILLGVRGEPRRDIETVVEVIIRISTIIEKCRDITDIEINPIVVYEKGSGIKALDARILFSKKQPSGGKIQ